MGDTTSEATSPYSTSGLAYSSMYSPYSTSGMADTCQWGFQQLLNQALEHPQANQHQSLQGEPSELSHQSRPVCPRSKMNEAQRRESKRLIDKRYRQNKKDEFERLSTENRQLKEKTGWLSFENRQLKEEAGQLSAENRQLKEDTRRLSAENRQLKDETGRLTLENKHLKERNRGLQGKGQHASELMQSQDNYISQSTSQVDHPSFSVQDWHCIDSNHEAAAVDGFDDGLEINELLLMEPLPEDEMIPNGRVAMNESASDKTESFLRGLHHTQMAMTEFLSKLDAEVMSNIDSSNFSGLEQEKTQVGRYSFPSSLIPVVQRINNAYGDISARCLINPRISGEIYVLFCATIKEMDDLQLEDVTEDRMLKWRDTIKDAQRAGFDVIFALEHLKKIACAYFGRPACLSLQHINERISKLEAEVNRYKRKHAKIYAESNSVIAAAEEFIGVPVSTGLFP